MYTFKLSKFFIEFIVQNFNIILHIFYINGNAKNVYAYTCFYLILGVIPHIHKSLIGKKGSQKPA